jgi:hypothetical protein
MNAGHRGRTGLCIAACVVVAGASIAAAMWHRSIRSAIPGLAARALDVPYEEEGAYDRLFDIPGVCLPNLIPAFQTKVAESSMVIGVVVHGQARAYMMLAMCMPEDAEMTEGHDLERDIKRHVVNDVIAESPISVTCCDISGCVRVLTAEGQSEPLALRVGGRREDKMLLLYEGQRYVQEDEAIPLHDVAFTVTSWGQWKKSHPSSLVYTGTF